MESDDRKPFIDTLEGVLNLGTSSRAVIEARSAWDSHVSKLLADGLLNPSSVRPLGGVKETWRSTYRATGGPKSILTITEEDIGEDTSSQEQFVITEDLFFGTPEI